MLPNIKSILYASDLSRNSAYAYRFALSCAEKYDAMINIVHIMEDMGPWAKSIVEGYLPKGHHAKVVQELKEHIENRLRVFCDSHVDESPECVMRVGSILVYEGNPAEEILKQAQKLGADLIFIGSHGKGSSTHPFFGSVARKVAGLSKIPVVVIPIPEDSDIVFTEI
ncbi:MAG: universal stress protein [Syntrophales bacterium]|jgi:nucleotide-binding universal stress UspA family protein|nr:universal stress protein [Syntrophales bacterium]MDX9922009.1 universal stress protein [Syntrophales bacterium]